jgi:YgiT-type zinc finger domain-containing protein
MKCPVCGKGTLSTVDDIVSEIGGLTFVERGRRCSHCGEEFIDEQDSQRTVKVARRLGIWGEPMRLHRKLSQSGRGIVLRIPEDLRRSMGLKGTETVSLAKLGKKRVLLEVETAAP